jgi:hypothetical protein
MPCGGQKENLSSKTCNADDASGSGVSTNQRHEESGVPANHNKPMTSHPKSDRCKVLQ